VSSGRTGQGGKRPGRVRNGLALLGAGAAGGWVGARLGIPAGVLIGALVASSAFRLAGGEPEPWRSSFGSAGRLLFGTVIGAAFGRDVLAPLRGAVLPMLVVTTVIIGVGLILGWALARFASLDIATSLLSSVPGGLPAMVAMADDSHADVTVVTAIHFTRLTTILLLMPALVPVLVASHPAHGAVTALAEPAGLLRTLVTVAGGTAAGWLALRLHVPTGDLIGPILVIGGINLLVAGPGPLPDGFRDVSLLLIGTAVGAQVSRESLRRLRQAALPAAAVIIGLISTGLVLGWGLAKVTTLDVASALLSSVPGGASTMPAIAHDLGGDLRLVAALHLTRQLVIFVLLPPVLTYLLRNTAAEEPSTTGGQRTVSNGKRP
jgi:membrane AbrB-like protein